MSIQELAHGLFEDQKSSWPLLGTNWEKLGEAQVKEFEFDGYVIRVQCNPKRIVSSAARVDKASIEKRACFLGEENRPSEEKNVWIGEDYEILCNPFPIFQEHFTIARADHTPQVIEPEFGRYLEISRELPDLAVFYNAPNCGASAPDHLHFQAGKRGFMPIEEEMEELKKRHGEVLYESPELLVNGVDDGLRRFYVLESGSREALESFAALAFGHIRKLQGGEPMINILAYYQDSWQVLLFPRDKHRPWQYFEEGEKNILLSPASVDMGGTLITPLEKDFLKISREDIKDIFDQVTFSEGNFNGMNDFIKAAKHD